MTGHQTEAEPPPSSVWGTFQARDARAMIEFLEVVGFRPAAVYADEDDPSIVQHAQLDWPEGGGVMLGSHKTEGWSLEPGTAGFYVVTADPRAVHARAVRARARITREPTGTDYGSEEFAMRDPEGNQWSFGTYRGEPRTS